MDPEQDTLPGVEGEPDIHSTSTRSKRISGKLLIFSAAVSMLPTTRTTSLGCSFSNASTIASKRKPKRSLKRKISLRKSSKRSGTPQRVLVPERARWNHIAAQDTDIGAALNKALAAIEDENDEIADRVLTSVDFNDKERLSDATLDELVTHFSEAPLPKRGSRGPRHLRASLRVPHPPIRRRRREEGGEFYTPREVVTAPRRVCRSRPRQPCI